MTPIRVFLVDDSAVVRRLVTEALSGHPGMRVVGSAPNGRLALPQIADLRPDAVIMDVEMPEMDGLQTLAALRAAGHRMPVIMFSTETRRGAAATLDALALGASDYVTKPVTAGGVDRARDYVRAELLPKIESLCGRRSGPASSVAAPAPAPMTAAIRAAAADKAVVRRPAQPRPVEVVAIGVSTGGPAALAALLPVLPPDLPVAVTIVLHMPPTFTRLLAERLAATCAIPVVEATADEPVRPGQVYLAPGGYHMTVSRNRRVGLNQGPPENFCRPAVDVLFRSVAAAYGTGVLAIILTGMGADGTKGCEVVREAGGQVVIQDRASSVVWGMPGSVAKAGLADEVLPLDHIASAITRRVRAGRAPVTT